MPTFVTLLLHPDRRRPEPAPLRVDLRAVILWGIGLWAAALLVCVVLLATGMPTARGVATSVVGLALGGAGLWWERGHRDSYRAGTSELPTVQRGDRRDATTD